MCRLYLVLTDSNGLKQAVFVDVKDKKSQNLQRAMKFGKKIYYTDYIELLNVLDNEFMEKIVNE